jgi:hypothetical protein
MKYLTLIFFLSFIITSCSNSKIISNDTLSNKDSSNGTMTKNFKDDEIRECVFDTSTYKFTTEALNKYKKNIKFTWNDKDKEAETVLENGDVLILHIGGCDHFSYSATLITDIPFTETKILTEKSRWLAKTFFDNGFDSKYDKCISKGLYQEEDSNDKKDLKSYQIIDSDTTETNMIYEGFQFWKLDNKTKIVISGYIN